MMTILIQDFIVHQAYNMQAILTTIRLQMVLLALAAVLMLAPVVVNAQTQAAPSNTAVATTVSLLDEEEADLSEAITEEEVEEIEDEIVTQVLTAQQLQEQLEDVYIRPYSYVQESDGTLSEVPVAALDDGTYVLKKRVIVGLDPVSWLAQPVIEDHIEFSGVTEPQAVVTLVVRANPIVIEDTIADHRGRWSIALGVDSLPAGEHEAYVQASTADMHSDEVAVASFYVEAREQVSNATWVLIIAIGLLLIIVLVIVNVQFYLHRRTLSRYTAPDVAKEDPDTHVEMDEEVIASVSEAAEMDR